MAEWLKAAVLKTAFRFSGTGVRLPLPPPSAPQCPDTSFSTGGNMLEYPRHKGAERCWSGRSGTPAKRLSWFKPGPWVRTPPPPPLHDSVPSEQIRGWSLRANRRRQKTMKRNLGLCLAVLGIIGILGCCQKKAEGDIYTSVVQAFADPPAEFRSAPLWVWNDRVTKEQVETQLADFKAHGMGGVFIHPRPGLITPYLSEEWLETCRPAFSVGQGLDMKVWIYDENSYPSGFAGGHVPAEMPDSVGKGLRLTKASVISGDSETKPLLVLRKTEAGVEDITEEALQPGPSRALGRGDYYFFDVPKAATEYWFGCYTYVDLMDRAVAEKFRGITL